MKKKTRKKTRKNSKKINKILLKKKKLIAIGIIVLLVIICFSVGKSYFSIQLAPKDDMSYRIRGVDLSSYQGDVDWDLLSKQNIAFAYIKATEGSSHVDKKFAYNWKHANDTNLRVGAYHFMSLETPGETQAENFIKTVDKKKNMLPPVIDVEFYGSFDTTHPSTDTLSAILDPLIKEIEDNYGQKPILYTTTYIYDNYISGKYNNDIWISDPEMDQPLSDGTKWAFCQYSFEGVIKGYSGNLKHIDLDVFYGTRSQFFAY